MTLQRTQKDVALFAVTMALPNFEKAYPGNRAPREALALMTDQSRQPLEINDLQRAKRKVRYAAHTAFSEALSSFDDTASFFLKHAAYDAAMSAAYLLHAYLEGDSHCYLKIAIEKAIGSFHDDSEKHTLRELCNLA